MSVVSVKVPGHVKEEMKRLRRRVRWPDEIRGFIEERIKMERRLEGVGIAEELLEDLPTQPTGTASRIVRGDRDSH